MPDAVQPGPKGELGDPGLDGQPGTRGTLGDTGDPGQPGESLITGDGLSGDRGDPGLEGERGQPGLQAPSGPKGDCFSLSSFNINSAK